MTHIPGLDKWLTTPPEDSQPSSMEFIEMVEKQMFEWREEWDSVVEGWYEQGESVQTCVNRLNEMLATE